VELVSPQALEPVAPAAKPVVVVPAASPAPQTAETSTGDLSDGQAVAPPVTAATDGWAGDGSVDSVTSVPLGVTSVPLAQFPLPGVNGLQPPAFLIPIYKAAGERYHVPWQILAAINWIETDYGANLSTSSAGAIGWMQFMPGTWQQYAVAADGHSQPNPYSPQDAIFTAAHYLAANGAAQNLPRAIYAYNHAAWYVAEVMWRAQMISDHSNASTNTSLAGTGQTGLAGTGQTSLAGTGQTGLAGAQTMLVAAYSAVGGPYSQANHDSFGQSAAELRRAGTDCSGFVSWVLDQVDPGFGNQTTVTLPDQPGILPGVGQYVTMWDRPLPGDQGHVIINILGHWFESGGNTAYNPAGGIAPMSEAEAVGELTGGGFLPYHLNGL
jgi:Transglycosylase SLT domain